MHEKVCIICPEHGEFWMTPSKHYSKKQGCPKCGIKRRVENQFKNKNEVIDIFNYPFDHINGHGCPKCGFIVSKSEDEIYDFISQYIYVKTKLLGMIEIY